MYFIDKYTYQILDLYRTQLELIDTIPIGFTGQPGEKPAPVFTSAVSDDVLYFGAFVDFFNAAVTVRIRSISPQYDWMANNDNPPEDTPVNAIAGIAGQILPILPLTRPYFLQKQGRLQLSFTNATTNPITGGHWVFRALRLTNPINGGWDYNVGLNYQTQPYMTVAQAQQMQ